MSRGDVIGGAAVPLTDALPWEASLSSSSSSRTFLVNDSMGTDGRFLLYTLASQVLSSSGSATATTATAAKQKRGRVLWLACGPVTEGQILQGLKKIGCDKTALSQVATANATTESLLTIRSLVSELSTSLLSSNDGEDVSFNEQDFAKKLYRYITETWLPPQTDDNVYHNHWIVLDDVSALANLLGEKLVYGLILALNAQSHQSSSSSNNNFGLVVRCSNDHEAESLPSFAGSSVASSGPEWFGAGGGSASSSHTTTNNIPWERSLIELADGVLDVLPLTSGYTRELHGRIVMTQMPHGRGWSDPPSSTASSKTHPPSSRTTQQQKQPSPMQIINYCITDQKIVAYII